ncbi:hypothetical protein GCM10023229_39490 [Flavisolibacter ginsenosidimutans]
MTVTHNYTGSNATGEDGNNTAETGAFGFGNDIHFLGDGTITVSFQKSVDNVKFSLFDIDYNQKVTITTNTGSIVTLASIGATTDLTLAGNGTVSASATAAATTAVATSSTDGTLNVNITGTVTSFSIVVTQTGTKNGKENGEFWLSDISACSPGTFATNYFAPSKPYTNQAGYVLTVVDNSVYYVDPVTGKSKLLFTDPGATSLNSLGYDPVKHYVYYVHDATGSGGTTNAANKSVYRYNYDMDTFGVAINDVTAWLPTFDVGVEIGGASFYDSSLYLGVDVAGGTNATKSLLWRIDFTNTTYTPKAASQVFATDGSKHDWGDLGVTNGVLYDFDSKATFENYYHQDLYTKNMIAVYSPTGSNTPKQMAIDWNNQLYSLGNSGGAPSTGVVIPYNGDGTVNTAAQKTLTLNGTNILARYGDAGEAFKPKVDFGDAPASYDPVGSDPAMHEISSLLYLGTSSSNEWVTRGQTALANSDNYDDGMVSGSLVNPSSGSYYCSVKYLNNTGSTATICAWVDFNNNGVFDPGEGKMIDTLSSSATPKTIFITWSGISSSLTAGQYTYIRVRIAPTANGMTTSNATGFFGDGEVEDYRLPVSINPLATSLVTFNAVNKSGKAHTSWQIANEEAGTEYTVQRSTDAMKWYNVYTQTVAVNGAAKTYVFDDPYLLEGTVYYRLQIAAKGTAAFSNIQKLQATDRNNIRLTPNPASSFVAVTITTETPGNTTLQFFDASGRSVWYKNVTLVAGENRQNLDLSSLPKGVYWMRLQNASSSTTTELLIKR